MTQSELEQRLTALGGRLAEVVPAWQGTLTAALRNETGSCVLAEFEAGTEEMRGSDRNEEAFAAVFAQKREVWAALLVETPYTLQIANTLTALPAELDDMAQIVGLTARVSPSLAAPALKKALHRRGACLVRGRGMLVTGRSAQEAVTAAVLLEKACRTHVLAQKIGGAKRVPLLSALLMHIIYQKKYSAIDLTEQSRRGEGI